MSEALEKHCVLVVSCFRIAEIDVVRSEASGIRGQVARTLDDLVGKIVLNLLPR